MDIVSYSYADKQSKRIDNLFHVGETAPAKVVLGQEWAVPSTGKVYKRVNDGTQDLWKDITGQSNGYRRSDEEYIAGTAKDNYTGDLTTFTLLNGYKVGFVSVYLNGRLLSTSDYTATGGISIVFNTVTTNGDVVKVVAFDTYTVGDAYTKAESDTNFVDVAGDVMTGTLETPTTRLRAPSGGSVNLVPTDGVTDVDVLVPTTDIASRDFVVGGDGYSWVDETVNRSAGTTYTNTTGKPIMVSVSSYLGSSSPLELLVDGVLICMGGTGGTVQYYRYTNVQAIVPNGSTYAISTPTISVWSELK